MARPRIARFFSPSNHTQFQSVLRSHEYHGYSSTAAMAIETTRRGLMGGQGVPDCFNAQHNGPPGLCIISLEHCQRIERRARSARDPQGRSHKEEGPALACLRFAGQIFEVQIIQQRHA